MWCGGMGWLGSGSGEWAPLVFGIRAGGRSCGIAGVLHSPLSPGSFPRENLSCASIPAVAVPVSSRAGAGNAAQRDGLAGLWLLGMGSSACAWDQGRAQTLWCCWGSAPPCPTRVIPEGNAQLCLKPSAHGSAVGSRPGSRSSTDGERNGMFNKEGSELAKSLGTFWPWKLKAFFSGMRR